MNAPNQHPDDADLSRALRSARPEPALPPRFQEGVWRRIAETEAPAPQLSWLDVLTVFVLRPRFAVTTALALILAGALLGMRDANLNARHDAQARYVAAVAPNALR